MKKLPENLEEWIESEVPPFVHKAELHDKFIADIGSKGAWKVGAKTTSKEILSNPTSYGLIEIERVQSWADEIEKFLNEYNRPDLSFPELYKALTAWAKEIEK